MTAQLDHTVVLAHDRAESATFLAEILDLADPVHMGPFLAVEVGNGVTLDFARADGPITPTHYAFRLDDAEFDAAFERVRTRGLPYWADPSQSRPGEVGQRGDGRGVYFQDPSGHFLEILTRSR
jgi:hypothetical protein